MASLKAPLFEKDEENKRPPIDICMVVDRSGSMAGAKLNLVKEAMTFVVENLQPEDTMSIVTYDTTVNVPLEVTKTDKSGKEKAQKAIEAIEVGGSTDLCAGLLRGLDLMKGRKNPHEVSSVLLLTDGLANHGITSVDEMTRQMDKKNVKGCTVFTFGVGQDHDGKMLRTLAENGHGLYYFLKDPENIPVSFADCLGGLSSVVAQNISLKISGNEGVKILKSLNPKYKLTQGGPLPSNQITLEIGDIYSEEERDIIIMIKVPKFKREAEGSIEQICAQFTLEFFNILTTQSETHQVDVIIQRPEKLSGSQQPNEALDKQRNRIQVAEAMDEARNRADKGELDEAKKLLEKTKEKVNSSSTGKDEYCQKLSSQLDDCIQDMRSTEQYSSEGSKKMESSVQSHYLQRSTVETAMYETSSKVAYKSKAKKSLF
jgi:uncharacterized protein YegL/soluble cytochrome b562